MPADFERIVDIVFRGVDDIGPGLTSATRQIDTATRQLESIADPVAGVTKSLLLAETAILGVGAALTKVAIDNAVEFNSAFAEITTLIDAPVRELGTFRAELLDYSRESTQSLETITAATYAAISAGADYTDVLGILADAERLAVAGNADLEQSTVALQQAINSFGADALTSAQASDQLFTAVRLGVTTLPELASNLGNVSSTAAAAGLGFGDMLAAVSALTTAGLSTDTAITTLRATLTSILKPSADAANLAAELGIEFNAEALAARGLDGIMRDVAEATGGNVTEMTRLFGSVQGLQGATALAGSQAENFERNLRAMEDAAGATTVAFDRMADGADKAAARLANSIRAALIDFGAPLEDEYAGILDAIGSIFDEVGAGFQTGGPLASIPALLEQFAADLAETLDAVARGLPGALDQLDLRPITDGLEAIAAVFGDLDLSDPDRLAEVLQSLVDGFGTLQQFSASVLEFFRGLAELIGPAASAIASMDGDTAALVGTVGALSLAIIPLGAAITSLNTALRGVVGLGGILGGLLGAGGAAAVAGSATAIAGVATAVGTLSFALAQLTGADEVLNDILVPDWLAGPGATLGSVVADFAESLGFLGDEVQLFIPASDQVAGAFDQTAAAAGAAGAALDESVDNAGGLQTAMADAADSLGDFESELAGTVATAGQAADAQAQINDEIGTGVEAGRAWRETVVDGIRTYTQIAPSAQAAARETTAELVKQREASEELQATLAKIASDERIAYIRATVDLQIAEAEANAATFVASMEGLTETIASAGGALVDLFGITENPEFDRFGFELRRAAEQQREIQEQAAKDQSELVQAQIRVQRERERAYRRGDALIQVNGDGLEPILEELMYSLLRNVKITAAAEGVEELLGLSGI